MTVKQKIMIIVSAVGAVLFTVCLIGFILSRKKQPENGKSSSKKTWLIGLLISAWAVVGSLLTLYSGRENRLHIEFEMFSPRINVFGITVAQTTVIGLGVVIVITVLLLAFRLFAFPKFSADDPQGFQNLIETAVEAMDKFIVSSTSEFTVSGLSPYMMSVALFMMGCAFSELFGLRAPTSELTFTLSLGLCTLALINIYGIKKNGLGGRLRNMGGSVPAMRPIMIPLKAISDFAVPVSLACRLFGNMMGGMLVMDMLKGVLGGYGSGLPAVAGLYFNLFHPILQIYIFVTLSLTYINEAME